MGQYLLPGLYYIQSMRFYIAVHISDVTTVRELLLVIAESNLQAALEGTYYLKVSFSRVQNGDSWKISELYFKYLCRIYNIIVNHC
jgi:hypothetical protein